MAYPPPPHTHTFSLHLSLFWEKYFGRPYLIWVLPMKFLYLLEPIIEFSKLIGSRNSIEFFLSQSAKHG